LFTSQGCSSCPPADALLGEVARRTDVVALGFHIDYWDNLGWKDPFSTPQSTERQRRYAHLFGTPVYTPQLVVDGRADVVGSDQAAARSAATAAAAAPHGTLKAQRQGKTLHLEATLPAHSGADVLVAAVDDPPAARVERGENAGRTLSHVRVVRDLLRVGRADGTAWSTDVQLDARAAGLRLVAFAQERSSGRVLAAASLPPP
jgi:hypothetical protein